MLFYLSFDFCLAFISFLFSFLSRCSSAFCFCTMTELFISRLFYCHHVLHYLFDRAISCIYQSTSILTAIGYIGTCQGYIVVNGFVCYMKIDE